MATGKERYRYTGQLSYLSIHPGSNLPITRPLQVTLIAYFQFAKAAFLLGVGGLLQVFPEAVRAMPVLPFLLYAAAHGRDTHGWLLPVVAVLIAIVGYGLWLLKPWARRSVIASTGLMLIVWAHRFYVDQIDGTTSLKTPLEQKTVAFVLFFDAVIFLYMVAYDDIARAFGKRP